MNVPIERTVRIAKQESANTALEHFSMHPERLRHMQEQPLVVPDHYSYPDVLDFMGRSYSVDWLHPVGEGGFGSVYRAVEIGTNLCILIKKVLIGRPDLPVARHRSVRVLKEAGVLDRNHLLIGARKVTVQSGSEDIMLFAIPEEPGMDLKKYNATEFNRDPDAWYSREHVFELMLAIRTLLVQLLVLHKRGFQHRDVKPENIIFAGKRSRLVDFGLSEHVTQPPSGVISGTPYYMSPDMITSGKDPYTDVRALAQTFLEMLRLIVYHDKTAKGGAVAPWMCMDKRTEGTLITFPSMSENGLLDPELFPSHFRNAESSKDQPVLECIYVLSDIVQVQTKAGEWKDPFDGEKPRPVADVLRLAIRRVQNCCLQEQQIIQSTYEAV